MNVLNFIFSPSLVFSFFFLLIIFPDKFISSDK